MCGIAGILVSHAPPHDQEAALLRMVESLRHRGPDDSGVWMDPAHGVYLGHTRLSILDLSTTGSQPMTSCSGRYVIVYNGEIYNFQDIREVLASRGHVFRGSSDTEIVLAAFEEWGIGGSLQRFAGMFAFAVWDTDKRNLTLGRDRFGKKPLYYGEIGNRIAFGSEVHALEKLGSPLHIQRDILDLYLRRGCVPQPHSIYRNIRKVPPGASVRIDSNKIAEPVHYWNANEVAVRSRSTPFPSGERKAIDALEDLLKHVVAQRMITDVPFGAFLSGGIDSSTIVALMQAQRDRSIRTFTIGFAETDYDESESARAVAEHLGTDHIEEIVSPEQALGVIKLLPDIYDEPFADSSQIPTYLVSKLARQHVKVVLTGDGGDEVFGGYNRYSQAPALWKKFHRIPAPLRRLAARGILAVSPSRWDSLFAAGGKGVPRRLRMRLPGDKLHKGAHLLTANGCMSMYQRLLDHQPEGNDLVAGAVRAETAITTRDHELSFAERMMIHDSQDYLTNDILTKVDRATMAVSLEARAPLLDHRVFGFAWTLPMNLKIRNGEGKWLLRKVLYRYVPQALVERPKMGFGIPVGQWLRGPLQEWARELVDPVRLRREGLLRPEPVEQLWKEHLSGRRNWEAPLWDVLMFQQWLERRRSSVELQEQAAL